MKRCYVATPNTIFVLNFNVKRDIDATTNHGRFSFSTSKPILSTWRGIWWL